METVDISCVRAKYGLKEPRRILRNLFVLALAFVFLFTAFFSMASLQSSLNNKNGLGSYSLAAVYLSLLISSLFLPALIVHKLGCKWTLICCMIGYIGFIIAQFYPTFATLIPAGILLGACASPFWTAQSIYMTKISEEYAYLSGETTETVLQRFFGIFFLIMQTSHIWGNLMAATLLVSAEPEIKDNAFENPLYSCGANHCPNLVVHVNDIATISSGGNISVIVDAKGPDLVKVYMLSTIFLVISVLAALIIFFFLDGLERFGEFIIDDSKPKQKVFERAISTVKHWANPYQLLLIPMTIWGGFQQGFIGADFTAGYIACALGIHYIGYVFICYGIFNSISSYVFGRIAKHIGRPAVFVLAHCLHLCALLIMKIWNPVGGNPLIFFGIGALWGLGDGIFTAQISALNGSIFPDTLDAAFSNLRLWNSLGYLIAYINANKLCMTMKLYMCLGAIILSVFGYLIVEISVRRQQKKMSKNTLKINVEPKMKNEPNKDDKE